MAGQGDGVVRDGSVPRPLAVAAAWSWRLLLVAGAVMVLTLVLVRLATVVLPIVLALVLAAALEPIAARLRRRHWPAALAAVVVLLGLLAVVVLALWWAATSMAAQFGELSDAVRAARDDLERWLTEGPPGLSPERVQRLRQQLDDVLGDLGGGSLAGPARTAVELVSGLVLMLFTLFFLLKDGERIGAWLTERVPARHRETTSELARRTRFVLRRYLVATAVTGLIDAVLIGIGLLVLGVPAVLPLAVLTLLGGFVPIVGATIAGLVAALVALATGGLVDALIVVALTVAVQQIEGNVLQPFVLDRAVKLHALVTVWAVAAGLVVAGIIGAFLAVPFVAIAAQAANLYRTHSLTGADPDPSPGRP